MSNKYLQATFQTHDWKSPDESFRYNFAIVEPESELDNHPGLVILTDASRLKVSITQVHSLRMDLPSLLANEDSGVVVYWRIVDNPKERETILRKLTSRPVFHG